MSISFSEDAQQEVVTSSRVLPEDSGEGSLRPRLLEKEKRKKWLSPKNSPSARQAAKAKICSKHCED